MISRKKQDKIPLIVHFGLEAVNKDIKQVKNIMGLKIKIKKRYKLRVFVHGQILILLDSLKRIEFLTEKLNGFVLLAGVKINKQKIMIQLWF